MCAPFPLPAGRKGTSVAIEVKVRANESVDEALRRFRRKVRKSGLMQQIRRRKVYEKPSDKRRRKQRLAEKRQRQRNEQDTAS